MFQFCSMIDKSLKKAFSLRERIATGTEKFKLLNNNWSGLSFDILMSEIIFLRWKNEY